MPLASLPIRQPQTTQFLLHCHHLVFRTTTIRTITTRTTTTTSLTLNTLQLTTASSLRWHSSHHHHHRGSKKKRKPPPNKLIQFLMGGHTHDHDSHDDITLLTSKDTSNPGVRITRIGLYLLPWYDGTNVTLF